MRRGRWKIKVGSRGMHEVLDEMMPDGLSLCAIYWVSPKELCSSLVLLRCTGFLVLRLRRRSTARVPLRLGNGELGAKVRTRLKRHRDTRFQREMGT